MKESITKYKVILKDLDETIHKKYLTEEQAMSFKEENFEHGIGRNKTKFRIIPMTTLEVEEYENKSFDEKKQDYLNLLSIAQKNDINVGRKKINFTKQLGFHLVIIDKTPLQEVHHSEQTLKFYKDANRMILIKAAIKNESNSIFELFNKKYPNFDMTFDEFNECIIKITKL